MFVIVDVNFYFIIRCLSYLSTAVRANNLIILQLFFQVLCSAVAICPTSVGPRTFLQLLVSFFWFSYKIVCPTYPILPKSFTVTYTGSYNNLAVISYIFSQGCLSHLSKFSCNCFSTSLIFLSCFSHLSYFSAATYLSHFLEVPDIIYPTSHVVLQLFVSLILCYLICLSHSTFMFLLQIKFSFGCLFHIPWSSGNHYPISRFLRQLFVPLSIFSFSSLSPYAYISAPVT